jgi:phage replication-related protein YjqB (UPF0714/DUF867 family)
MDTYASFEALNAAAREGVDFAVRVVRRPHAAAVILAPHGGGIEPGTSEIAQAIAGEDLSLGAFEGIMRADNRRLHLTGIHFDEPRCLRLVEAADVVVTIHGEKRAAPTAFVGGRDTELRDRIHAALRRAGWPADTHAGDQLQGTDPRNICNRGRRGMGAQLELSAGLRRQCFAALTAEGRRQPTAALAKFAAAVREGILGAAPPR